MVLRFAPDMFRRFCLHHHVEKHLMPGVQQVGVKSGSNVSKRGPPNSGIQRNFRAYHCF